MSWLQIYEKALGMEVGTLERSGRDSEVIYDCYASRQTYVEVNDTYSEGGTHEETLHPQRKAKVMNKRRGD